MLNLRSATAAALLAFAAACGSDTATTTDPGTKPPTTAGVATVDVTPTTAGSGRRATAKSSAMPRDAAGNALGGRAVSWSSSNASIASVDKNGTVTGVVAGRATITASSEGKSAAAAITVKAAAPAVSVATVSIAAAPDTIEAWDPAAMQAITRDAKDSLLTDRAIRWARSNPAVATIDSLTGVLTGIDRGTVTVTATSEAKIGTRTRVVVIKYRSISAGTMHACDIASGGIAWCWGLNGTEGRIGSDKLVVER